MTSTLMDIFGAFMPTTENQACMWSEPDIVGWLDKYGGRFRSWKRRFFVLQGSYLFYFRDDIKVHEKYPLGVIPLDASEIDTSNEDLGDSSRRYTFRICLGKQFIGLSKRDTYVVAAPSHQAMEEWIERIIAAAEIRDVLLDQLQKARWRGGDLRRMLANSIGNREMLEYGARDGEGKALMTEYRKVQERINKLQHEASLIESKANGEEGALMRAMVVWDILNEYVTGNIKAGEPSSAQHRIAEERDAVQQLCQMLQLKLNYLRGWKIEYLSKESREELRHKVERALYIVQERQAKVRSKAPRYSFNSDPIMYEDEEDSLQQEPEEETEGSQPGVLRIHKDIRAEVLKTTEQFKNLKSTDLQVAGTEGSEESRYKQRTNYETQRGFNRVMASNSNIPADKMNKMEESGRDVCVQDIEGNYNGRIVNTWIQDHRQGGQNIGMCGQFSPHQSSPDWSQKPWVHHLRPPSDSGFGPAPVESHLNSGLIQQSGTSHPEFALRRPLSPFHLSGTEPFSDSLAPMPPQDHYRTETPAYPHPSFPRGTRSMSQFVPNMRSNQSNMFSVSHPQESQSASPRKQISPMAAVEWQSQEHSALRPMMQAGNRGQFTASQPVFSHETILPPPSTGRQFHHPSPIATAGKLRPVMMPQEQLMAGRMQQQVLRPKQDAQNAQVQQLWRPQPSTPISVQTGLLPRTVPQNFSGSRPVASSQQMYSRLPVPRSQQNLWQHPQTSFIPPNSNRPSPQDLQSRPMLNLMQSTTSPPFNPPRPFQR
ncbi:hypothetical protein KP509_32G027300 [Ceratopteris richardii]|uniref:PH domain-containing protein n=1 Tax=Ceratopteris richardii TaxID=49495 RepID=A0A8T2QU70_CERRI|nr:hypothetical protein KP509_32G027300 [Ceratopteris richardii]